jgi:hypothetical protein
MFTLLIAMFHVIAAETLDHEMTPQERKKTGVSKLTDKEKASLQQWVDTHYEKRGAPLGQDETVEQRSLLQEVLRNGSYIRLANGTLWNINPDDTNISQGWITPVDILVTQSGDPAYPYKLTNSLTGSALRARKVDKIF